MESTQAKLILRLTHLKQENKLSESDYARLTDPELLGDEGINACMGYLIDGVINEQQFMKYVIQLTQTRMPVALVRAVITNDRFGLASLMDNEVEAQLARSRETPFSNLAAQFAPIKKTWLTIQECLFYITQSRSKAKFTKLLLEAIISSLCIEEAYVFEQILGGFECFVSSKAVKDPTHSLDETINWFQSLPERQLLALRQSQLTYQALQVKGMTHVIRDGQHLYLLRIGTRIAKFMRSAVVLGNIMKLMSNLMCLQQADNESVPGWLCQLMNTYLICLQYQLRFNVTETLAQTTGVTQSLAYILRDVEYNFEGSPNMQISNGALNVLIQKDKSVTIQSEHQRDLNHLLQQLDIKTAKLEHQIEVRNQFYPSSPVIYILQFDKLLRLAFSSSYISSDIKLQFRMKSKIKFNDFIYQIFENNQQLLLSVQQMIANSLGLDQQVEFTDENQHCTIIHRLNNKGVTESLQLVLFYQPPKRNIKQLMAMFRMKVRLLSNLHKATSAFKSKQTILKSNNYMKSALVEYLSERDIKQIMLTNEAHIKDIDVVRDQTEHLKHNVKQSEKFVNLLGQLEPYIPQSSILILSPEIQQQIDNPQFNILGVDSQDEKVQIVWNLLHGSSFTNGVAVPKDQFCNFITIIRHKYNKNQNTFHNLLHGITVMHGCYQLQRSPKFAALIKDIEQFTLILSGLCHDLDHNATSNMFEVNSMSKLAIRYSDKSVLENHHIAQTFKVINQDQCNILKGTNLDQYNTIRLFMINNILATDNKHHFQTLNDLELKIKQYADDPLTFENQDGRLILSGFLIHSADFYGAVQPFKISNLWSTKVNQEFMAQYALEEKLGLPQTPYYKGLDNPKSMAKNEIGFLKVIVKPLWEIIVKFSEEFQQMIDNTNQTMATYDTIANAVE